MTCSPTQLLARDSVSAFAMDHNNGKSVFGLQCSMSATEAGSSETREISKE